MCGIVVYTTSNRGRRGRDRMVVGYSIQHNVIKFVSDLRQVGGLFLGTLRERERERERYCLILTGGVCK
jgi:hypothetical protein